LLGLNGPLMNEAWPGGLLLPDWVVQPAVAFVTRKIGDEPSPAILPEHVTSVALVCAQLGPLMKCGFAATATDAVTRAAIAVRSNMIFANRGIAGASGRGAGPQWRTLEKHNIRASRKHQRSFIWT
jgi:hypothetical protein